MTSVAVDFSSLNHKFTPKEMGALEAYQKSNNKVEAYRASYSVANMNEASISKAAKNVFKKPHMVQAIELIKAAALEKMNETLHGKAVVDAAWVLSRAVKLADFNIRKFIKIVDGCAIYDFTDATDDDWYCISEYVVDDLSKFTPGGKIRVERTKLKTVDKLKALELVGRHVTVQAFKDTTDINTSGTVVNVTMSPEEYKNARKQAILEDDC